MYIYIYMYVYSNMCEIRYCIFARLKKINNTEFSSNEKNLSTLEKKKKK